MSERRLTTQVGTTIAALFLAAIGLTCGCEAPPRGDRVPVQAPSYASLAEAHNARIKLLQTLYADGVIEIRWRDRDGKHFEQGNMELWIEQPSKTALRVEKLGEVLLWLGSDDQRYWLFDMVGDEKVLYVGPHDQPRAIDESGALSVRPRALLDLMGLSALPESGGEAAPVVRFDQAHHAWAVQTTGGGGPLRLYFDRGSLLPVRAESLTDAGEIALFSTLRRYESAPIRGMSPAGYPKVAELVDIASPPGAANSQGFEGGQVKIAIGEARGDISHDEASRVFDFNRLQQGLRPHRIESGEGSRAAAGP